jgi:peptidoglycan hydrolase-like protein with peptidoglycan-binding domain
MKFNRLHLFLIPIGLIVLQSCSSATSFQQPTTTSSKNRTETSALPIQIPSTTLLVTPTVVEPKTCTELKDKKTLPLIFCDNGTLVVRVQAALAALGSNIHADGAYGIFVRSAVKDFQSTRGMTATGQVDENTWQLLIGESFTPVASWLASSSLSEKCDKLNLFLGKLINSPDVDDKNSMIAQSADIVAALGEPTEELWWAITSYDSKSAVSIISTFITRRCS